MTKAEIVEKIYEQVGFSKRESAEIVDAVFELMKQTLEKEEKIKVSGFGNFVVRSKRQRIGRNPHTREAITISARKVVTFKASQILKAAVNGGKVAPGARASDPENE
jgi:integration host factor subunit alpha